MTFSYYASFDVSDPSFALGTITLSRSGSSNIVVNLANITATAASGTATVKKFCHYSATGLGNTITQDRYLTAAMAQSWSTQSFAGVVTTFLVAAAVTAGWPNPSSVICSFNMTTLRYTFTHTSAFTAIAWSQPAGRSLFGFVSNFSGSSTSVAGTAVPHFAIQPTQPDICTVGSDDFLNYEPNEVSSTAVSQSGMFFGMSRTASVIFRDWVQQYETKEKTLRLSAASTHTYTFEAFIQDCRSHSPFVVFNSLGTSSGGEVFGFRKEGAHTGKQIIQRASDGNDAAFHIKIKTIVCGSIA